MNDIINGNLKNELQQIIPPTYLNLTLQMNTLQQIYYVCTMYVYKVEDYLVVSYLLLFNSR